MTTVEYLYSEIRAKYTDSNYHVVQADRDGGDSTHGTGATHSCMAVTTNSRLHGLDYHAAMLANEYGPESPGPGRYCRNPEHGRWYSNYYNQTRDAMINLQALWALLGDTVRARRHFAKRIKRLMFHFSEENDGYDSGLPLIKKFPDAPTPVELAIIIRAGRYVWLTPLLLVLDLFFILDCAITRRLNERNLYDSDAKLLPCMLAALAVYPTPWIRIAKWFYAKSDAEKRLRSYYAEGVGLNGIEPLGQLMAHTFRTKIQDASD